MTQPPMEEEVTLRALVQETRHVRQHEAPSFHRLWRQAQEQHQRDRRSLWPRRMAWGVAATVACAMVVAAVGLMRPTPQEEATAPMSAQVMLDRWPPRGQPLPEGPTDFLLELPGQQWLTATSPTLTQPVIPAPAIGAPLGDPGLKP